MYDYKIIVALIFVSLVIWFLISCAALCIFESLEMKKVKHVFFSFSLPFISLIVASILWFLENWDEKAMK